MIIISKVETLTIVLETTKNFLIHLLNRKNKTFVLDKLDEFMIVPRLEELCNHPVGEIRNLGIHPVEEIRNLAFTILSLIH